MITIALVVVIYFYLPTPKHVFFVMPCEIGYFIETDDKRNLQNQETCLCMTDFIKFLDANNFLSWCPRMGQETIIFTAS